MAVPMVVFSRRKRRYLANKTRRKKIKRPMNFNAQIGFYCMLPVRDVELGKYD